MPENSYRAAKSGNLYYFSSHDAHYEIWKNKWGFDRNWQVLYDKIPNEVGNMYRGTLLGDFIKHDYREGPLKSFNL